MQHHRINSISDLQAEQRRLKGTMKQARSEVFHSARQTSGGASSYLLKKVMLPAGAIGLGALVAKKLLGENEARGHSYRSTGTEQDMGWLSRLVMDGPLFVQQFLSKLGISTAPGTAHDMGQKLGAALAKGPAGLLAVAAPLALPLFQRYLANRAEHADQQALAANGTQRRKGFSAIFGHLLKLLPIVLPLVLKLVSNHNDQQQLDEPARQRHAGAVA